MAWRPKFLGFTFWLGLCFGSGSGMLFGGPPVAQMSGPDCVAVLPALLNAPGSRPKEELEFEADIRRLPSDASFLAAGLEVVRKRVVNRAGFNNAEKEQAKLISDWISHFFSEEKHRDFLNWLSEDPAERVNFFGRIREIFSEESSWDQKLNRANDLLETELPARWANQEAALVRAPKIAAATTASLPAQRTMVEFLDACKANPGLGMKEPWVGGDSSEPLAVYPNNHNQHDFLNWLKTITDVGMRSRILQTLSRTLNGGNRAYLHHYPGVFEAVRIQTESGPRVFAMEMKLKVNGVDRKVIVLLTGSTKGTQDAAMAEAFRRKEELLELYPQGTKPN